MKNTGLQKLALYGSLAWVLAGCAAVPAGSGGVVPAPAPARVAEPATTREEPAREPAHVSVVRDSTPSADAQRVLQAIPEPLSAGQQVPPPPSTALSVIPATPRSAPVAAPEVAYDTLRVGSASDTVPVPVPSPTQPLGTAAGATLAMPDTLPPPVLDPVKPVVTTPAPAPKPNEPCWRLQIAAPAEKPMAESRRDAAQSLLTVPFSIEFEKTLYKVRTRDCMTREAADALKRRAADSGFEGAFVVDTHAATSAAAPKPATHSAKKKPKH